MTLQRLTYFHTHIRFIITSTLSLISLSTVAHRQYLDQEVALSEDMVHKYSDMVLSKLNKAIGELRRLFLVEDLVDSIKVRTTLLQASWTPK